MIRRSKMNQSLQFVGCMNCEGCRRAPRRPMHSPHRALGLVLVLATRAAGTERFEAHVGQFERNRLRWRPSSLKTPMNQFLRLWYGRRGPTATHRWAGLRTSFSLSGWLALHRWIKQLAA